MNHEAFPEIQVENLKAVLHQIETHPETWKQSSWHCGTSHCFAGWAQIMAGKPALDSTVRVDARKWLGLTAYEMNDISDSWNDIDRIRALVADYISPDYNRAGYNCDGYDRDGWDRDGWDFDGLNRQNLTRAEAEALKQ